MSDQPKEEQQTTLDDVDAGTNTNESEAVDKPVTRSKRSLIDVPTRKNVGADGTEIEEFS